MMVQALIALLLLTNLYMLGSSRLGALIQAVAGQAFLLSMLTVLIRVEQFVWYEWLLVFLTIAIKCLLLPALMRRALRETNARREIEPLVGYSFSLFLGLMLLGASLWTAWRLPLPNGETHPLVVACALFTFSVGLCLVVSRTKAITQTIGYLVMENGIYMFGHAVAVHSPLIVELGVLLDVFVGVFVMGIMILNINRAFDRINTYELATLKD